MNTIQTRGKILVVEDTPSILDPLRTALENQGCQIILPTAVSKCLLESNSPNRA